MLKLLGKYSLRIYNRNAKVDICVINMRGDRGKIIKIIVRKYRTGSGKNFLKKIYTCTAKTIYIRRKCMGWLEIETAWSVEISKRACL